MIDPSIPLQIQPPKIDDPLAAYGKVLNIQNAQQQQQMGAQKIQSNAMELKQQQRALDYQNVFTQSLQKHTTQNQDGSLATDWGGVQGDVTNAGYGPEAVKMNADIMKAKEAGLDLLHKQNQADLDRTQAVSRTVGSLPKVDTTAPPDVQAQQKAAWSAAALTGITNLVKSGHMPQQQGAALAGQIQQAGWTPELQAQAEQLQMQGLTAEQQIQHVQKGIDQQREAATQKATVEHLNAETDKVKGESSEKARNDAATLLAGSTSAASYDAKKATLDPKIAAQLPDSKELNWASPADAQKQILRAGMAPAQVAEDERGKKLGDNTLLELRSKGKTTGNASIDALSPKEAGSSLQRLKPPPTNVSITNLSPAALDQAAQSYATTGQLPTLGFGKEAAGMRAKIMERAAELNPTNDLAAAKTDYAANQQAIKDVTKNRSRVLTSEGTAAKNLSLVTDLSKKVSRTGSPIVNKYLLSLKGKVAGDDETQMLNNAVETVANEYANVVTAGSSGGAATTDASRAHARDMIHSAMGDGTLQKVAVLMRKEMSNRHSAFDEQLADLRSGRSKTGAAGTGAAAASTTQAPAGGATKRYNPATGQIETVK